VLGSNGAENQSKPSGHLKARFFIDVQPEHIRTRVVPGHVQVELPFGDLARIEIGGKNLLT
jgi:hypothetical protein